MPSNAPNILLILVDQMRTPRWFPADLALPAYACSFINPHDIMFFCRTMPPDNCAERCRLPDNHVDDLTGKPRIQAQYQRFWGGVMGMTPDQPEALWRRYGDFYLYLTQRVDAEIARVLAALDASGEADDTLTIFLSDHGEMAGAHKLQGKGPFVYHENVQVPLIFRWPGRVAPATTTDALAQNIDLFPTLLDLAGIGSPPPHLPGRSLAPLVLGEAAAPVNDHVILILGHDHAAHPIRWRDRGSDPRRGPWPVRRALQGGTVLRRRCRRRARALRPARGPARVTQSRTRPRVCRPHPRHGRPPASRRRHRDGTDRSQLRRH